MATITKALKAGEKAEYRFKGEDFEVEVKEDIPVYHKIALEDIPKGSVVYKYGCKIGYALDDIAKGTHVHTENLDSKMR